MACLKCGGCTTREPVPDLYEHCTLERCIQCGSMMDWLMLKNREASQERGAEVPTFLREYSRRAKPGGFDPNP